MALLNMVGNMIKNMDNKADGAEEITKLATKINSEQKQIEGIYYKIGEIYYRKYQTGEPMLGEVNDLCAEIDKHNATINEAKDEIERIKAKETTVAKTVASNVTCSSCGKVNMHGGKFCQMCGAKLESKPAPATDGVCCPSCGSKNDNERKFCKDCGSPLKS